MPASYEARVAYIEAEIRRLEGLRDGPYGKGQEDFYNRQIAGLNTEFAQIQKAAGQPYLYAPGKTPAMPTYHPTVTGDSAGQAQRSCTMTVDEWTMLYDLLLTIERRDMMRGEYPWLQDVRVKIANARDGWRK